MTTFSPLLILGIILVLYLISSIKILNEYERGVVFRLGKLLPRPKGPGLVLVFSPIDRMVRVSLRTVVLDVPPQDIITRDNVSVKVNAVVYFRVMEPSRFARLGERPAFRKHVDLPQDMQRAMARQAEAEREKRAKIIHAEGELTASEKLSQAAAVMNTEPLAITLRYLQTLTEIASEQNSTIFFPIPIEMLRAFEAFSARPAPEEGPTAP